MSRSYRAPYATQGYGDSWRKYAKRKANKKVRKARFWIPDGNWFKKLYESWDIVDWKFWSPNDSKIKRK